MPTLDSLLDDAGSIKLAPQHVIVYGPPFSGKTQLIGKLAEHYKLTYFDLDNGKSTLLKMPKEVLKNITYLELHSSREEPTAHATIDKIVRGGDFNICDLHGRVDCPVCRKDGREFTFVSIPKVFNLEAQKNIVVIDSGTELSGSIMHTTVKGKPIDYQETLHDFRNQGNYLNRIFSYIQHAPFHIIVTAHEVEAEREDGSVRIVPSIGTRNYAINCGRFFDHAVYLDKINMKHKAFSSTGYSNSVLTGSRLDVAVEKMAVPDLLSIFEGKVEKVEESKVVQAGKLLGGIGGKDGKDGRPTHGELQPQVNTQLVEDKLVVGHKLNLRGLKK